MPTPPYPIHLLNDLDAWVNDNPEIKDQVKSFQSTITQIALTESESELNWNYLEKILQYIESLYENGQLSEKDFLAIQNLLANNLQEAATKKAQS